MAALFFLFTFTFEVFDSPAGLLRFRLLLFLIDAALLLLVRLPVGLLLDLHAFALEEPPLLVRELLLLFGQFPAVFLLDLTPGVLFRLPARFEKFVLLLLSLFVDPAPLFCQLGLGLLFEARLFDCEIRTSFLEAALEIVLHFAQALLFLPAACFGRLLLELEPLFQLASLGIQLCLDLLFELDPHLFLGLPASFLGLLALQFFKAFTFGCEPTFRLFLELASLLLQAKLHLLQLLGALLFRAAHCLGGFLLLPAELGELLPGILLQQADLFFFRAAEHFRGLLLLADRFVEPALCFEFELPHSFFLLAPARFRGLLLDLLHLFELLALFARPGLRGFLLGLSHLVELLALFAGADLKFLLDPFLLGLEALAGLLLDLLEPLLLFLPPGLGRLLLLAGVLLRLPPLLFEAGAHLLLESLSLGLELLRGLFFEPPALLFQGAPGFFGGLLAREFFQPLPLAVLAFATGFLLLLARFLLLLAALPLLLKALAVLFELALRLFKLAADLLLGAVAFFFLAALPGFLFSLALRFRDRVKTRFFLEGAPLRLGFVEPDLVGIRRRARPGSGVRGC